MFYNILREVELQRCEDKMGAKNVDESIWRISEEMSKQTCQVQANRYNPQPFENKERGKDNDDMGEKK